MNLGGYEYKWLVLIGMLVFFAVRVGIGYWASRMVSDTADYIVAGRRLPVYIAAASIMATWFAAETLMGAAATAYRSGFQGVIFDPFGAFICLLISGLFFIRLMPITREHNTLEGEVDIQNAVWDAVYIASTPALLASVFAMLVATWLTHSWDTPRPLTDVDGNPLPLSHRLGILPPKDLL